MAASATGVSASRSDDLGTHVLSCRYIPRRWVAAGPAARSRPSDLMQLAMHSVGGSSLKRAGRVDVQLHSSGSCGLAGLVRQSAAPASVIETTACAAPLLVLRSASLICHLDTSRACAKCYI